MKQSFLLYFSLVICSFNLLAQVPQNFDADAIYVLIDTELEAKTYAEVTLSNNVNGQDEFIIIPKNNELKRASYELSNSLKGYSNQAVCNSDGRYVIVSSGDSAYEGALNYASGNGFVRVLDTKHGTVTEEKLEFPVGALAINYNKGLIAVAPDQNDENLILMTWKGKSISNTLSIPLKHFEKGDKIVDLNWSNSGSFLAVCFENSNSVAFYRLTTTKEGIELVAVGQPVSAGLNPGVGLFGPEDKYYYVADQSQNFNKGAVSVIRTNLVSGAHDFVQSAPANIGPESMVLSPDGKYLITLNRRGAHLSASDKKKTRMSSVSVMKLAANGKLKPMGEYPFETVYPSDISFDKSGNMLVVVAQQVKGSDEEGELLFWDFYPKKKSQLDLRDERVVLPKGAHTLILK